MQRSPTCPSCWKNYEFKDFRPVGSHIPLLLSCGHAFCEGCLLKLSKKKENIECLTCQSITQLQPSGERGVKNLLPDIYLLGILTYNKRLALEREQNQVIAGPAWKFGNIYHLTTKQATAANEKKDERKDSKENAEETTSEISCEECLKPATCICKSCDDCHFCDDCFTEYHKALKRLQKHQRMPLSFPRKSELECKEHPGRILEFFDKDLDQPVCALCVILEKCKGHCIVPIGELDADIKEELNSLILSAKDTLQWLKISEQTISNVIPELGMVSSQFCQDVRSYFSKMHTLLQMREASILEDAAVKFSQNFGLEKTIQDCLKNKKRIQAAIEELECISREPHILRLKVNELLANLREFKDMECFAKRIDGHVDIIKFVTNTGISENLKAIGHIEIEDSNLIKMMKANEIPEEELEFARETAEIFNQCNNAGKPNEQDKISLHKVTLTASFELVYITYVKSPENFFVQRCSDKERLQVMMHALNKYCRTSDNRNDLLFSVEKDDLVCAQFLSDNNWYRARIINPMSTQQPDVIPTWQNGLPVEVHYIDYGNTECLPLARLRKIKTQYLDVPELAVRCSLVDIVPPNKQEKWPLNSVKAFNSLTGEKPMLMNIRGRLNGKLFIDLRRPDDDEPTQDDERPVSVRDALVFLDVAKFMSPASAPQEYEKSARHFKDPQALEAGEILDVIVTHVVNPHQIYVQKFESSISDIHNELATLYSAKNKGGMKIPFPYKDLVCAARFSEDKLWYRGLITRVHDDCNKIDVEFVDYGNSEKTSLSEIRRLPNAFLTLRKQAMLVKLKDVAHPEELEEWPKEAIDFLSRTVLNKPMVLIAKGIENGRMEVELCDTSTDDDIYINHLLVKEGHAICIGPSAEDKAMQVLSQNLGDQLNIGCKEDDNQSRTRTDEAYSDIDDTTSCSVDVESDVSAVSSVYRNQDIPFAKTFDVMGTFVDDFGFIYGHKIEEDTTALTIITQKLNDGEIAGLPGLKTSNDLTVGQICVAPFSEDGLWYRSAVTQILDDKHVEVEFVDFGNKEVTEVENVRLSHLFLNLPKQAMKLKLYSIESVQEDGKYPEEAYQTLQHVMVNQRFTATLEGPQNNPETFNVSIKVAKGEDLAEALIKAGLAKRVVMDEHPDGNVPIFRMHRLVSLPVTADFIQPTLPQIGVHFDITVTQVERPNMLFVQRLPAFNGDVRYAQDDDDTEQIAKEQINDLRAKSLWLNSPELLDDRYILEKIRKGMACCARYSADGEWYRAKIMSFTTSDNTKETAEANTEANADAVTGAEVIFIDYGTSEFVPMQCIRRIPEDFLELPAQGICCEIAGILPPQNSKGPFFKDTKWPIDTMKKLYKIVADKRMIASIMDYGPPVRIMLFDRCNVDGDETGKISDVSVAKLLSDANLALFSLDDDCSSNSTDAELHQNVQLLTRKRASSTRLFELPNLSDTEEQ